MATLDLLSAEDPDAATRAYWRIENHAVIQGELFEVSEPCASALVAALADPRPMWVRVAVLELLFQFLRGHASEAPGTPPDIRERCERAVREGLHLLFREALTGERDAALDILEELGEGSRAQRLVGRAGES